MEGLNKYINVLSFAFWSVMVKIFLLHGLGRRERKELWADEVDTFWDSATLVFHMPWCLYLFRCIVASLTNVWFRRSHDICDFGWFPAPAPIFKGWIPWNSDHQGFEMIQVEIANYGFKLTQKHLNLQWQWHIFTAEIVNNSWFIALNEDETEKSWIFGPLKTRKGWQG